MSIIYSTLERLERLETDNPPLAYNKDKASSPRLTVESKGFPVKTVATVMMVVITGTSLMLWHQSDEVGGPKNLAPATATKQSVAAGKSAHELSPASIGEPSTDTLESTEPNSETPTERDAVPVVPMPTDMVAVTGKQRIAVKQGSPELDSIEEPFIVADVRADTVSSPVAKPKIAPAEPDERKQIPSSETAQPGGVEEVIERARLALSRGRYQQALSALEPLEPVPENRADFWLIKGSAHLGIGQLDLSEMAFASAQALAPDNVQIALQQAILKQEKGDHASALQILKGVAIRHPNVPEIFLNQGYSQQAVGSVREAKRSFRTFLQMTESRSLYLQQRKVVKEWLAQVSSIQ
jgi:Flp pilus assembly protein TadD